MKTKWMAVLLTAAATLALEAPAEAKCTLGKLFELPVTMDGLQPMVSASVNGREVRFMADSGAFFSLISPGMAAELGLKLRPAPEGWYLQGVGGTTSMSVVTVKTLGLDKHDFKNVDFIVGGSELTGAGVIGQNILYIADVEYDLQGGAIRLMRPDGCGKANLAYWAGDKPVSAIAIEPTSIAEPHTTATVVLNGVKLRAIFDTGASTTILSTAAAARAGVTPNSDGVVDVGTISGVGRRRIHNWIGAFTNLQIGDEEIRRIKLRFGDIGPDADMLIGADFFLSHHVYVSNSRHLMFFTYNGGPVFSITDEATRRKAIDLPTGGPEPTTAEDYARRGALRQTRGALPGALADFSKAIELAPGVATHFEQRAGVYVEQKDRKHAIADLDQAIKLKPDNAETLLFRAGLRLVDKDRDGALADVDAAARVAAPSSDLRLSIGALYTELGAADLAVAQMSRWIVAHPDDQKMAEALNSRCWARALGNIEPAKAVADCDRALRLSPGNPAFLDSRGLAHLRAGELDKAMADYAAALAKNPEIATSFYGRGVVRLRKGMTKEGEADIAAAKKLDPDLDDLIKRYGLPTK